MKTEGYLKEDEIIYFLKNHKVKDLNPNLYSMVKTLYGVLDPEWLIKCEYGIELTKPDFVITINDKKKYVSMKSGKAEYVHGEPISTFIPFLRSIGVSKETLRTLLLYHFGDGTLDGTGKNRMSGDKVADWLNEKLIAANQELSEGEIMWKIIDRCLFQGIRNDVPPADAIYFGDVEYGKVATKKQIKKHYEKGDKRYRNLTRSIHIGPLIVKPEARYAGVPIKSEKKHMKVTISWMHLREDIEYINKHYDSYTPMRHRTYEE